MQFQTSQFQMDKVGKETAIQIQARGAKQNTW